MGGASQVPPDPGSPGNAVPEESLLAVMQNSVANTLCFLRQVRGAALAALESAALRPSFRADILRGSSALRAWIGCGADGAGESTAVAGDVSGSGERRLWHATATIHPSAMVDPAAALDAGAVVGAGCVVGPGALIGADVVLSSHVVVPANTAVGDLSRLHPFSCVGGDPQDRKYSGEASWLLLGKRSVIGEHATLSGGTALGVVIREHATLSRGTALGGFVTSLGEGCLIMVHVAHDCALGDGVVVSSGTSLAGHVSVGDHAIIGGHSGVLQRVRIGTRAMTHAGVM
ncbi:trimeric LpxA-like protein [Baffinella frigidus]|nr:trimeric LpxA-like protein [Cryptophyta sp. CCMP2293]